MPRTGEAGHVLVNSVPLQLIPGTYECTQTDRFGEKVSMGDLRYADFTPDESGVPITSGHLGYGLRRHSDLADRDKAMNMVLEADGVECSEAGIFYLSPFQFNETLPTSGWVTQGPAVWIGDFNDKVVCVAGDAVFERDTTEHFAIGTWTKKADLAGTAVRGAVGVFNDRLVVGYGSTAVAQWLNTSYALTNVQDTTPAGLYVWAFTADRASAYIAGGPASTDHNKVTSSTHGGTGYSLTLITCSSSSTEITGLTPGGGLVLPFVAKEDELGAIDTSSVYRPLIPFGSKGATNGRGMRWWLGSGGDEQRGPLVLFFPVARNIWTYQPSTQTAGQAANISPWAAPGIRPLNVRGDIVSIQGSSRWLYYVVRTVDSNSYIVKRDARTGATSNHLKVGSATNCYALHITSALATTARPNSVMFFGKGNNVSYVILPLDGESALSDPNCRFNLSGTVTFPDRDMYLPDELKALRSERLVTEEIPGGCTVKIEASLDSGSWQSLGTTGTGTKFYDVVYTSSIGRSARRCGARLTLTTTDNSRTPQVRALIGRMALNTKIVRKWAFWSRMPGGLLNNNTWDVADPYQSINTFEANRRDNDVVEFRDYFGNLWNAKIKKVGYRQVEIRDGDDAIPEWQVYLELLEYSRGASVLTYNDGSAFNASRVTWG